MKRWKHHSGPTTCRALLLVVFVACRAERRVAEGDSVRTSDSATTVAVPSASARGWSNEMAGPVLAVPSGDTLAAALVLPALSDGDVGDTAMIAAVTPTGPLSVDLFSRHGRVGAVTLEHASRIVMSDTVCTSWPVARLGAGAGAWTVALAAGRARAVPLDSMSALSRADSIALTADVMRLASAQPGSAPAFRGLPFVVRTLYRFSPAPGVHAVAATTVRHLNVEANPREEDLFLIAERDSTSSSWSVGYVARSSGAETDAETTDVLAVLLLGARGQPVLAIGRDTDDGATYGLLFREPDGRWRLSWESAYTGC